MRCEDEITEKMNVLKQSNKELEDERFEAQWESSKNHVVSLNDLMNKNKVKIEILEWILEINNNE